MKCPECGERMTQIGIVPFYQDGDQFTDLDPLYLGWDCAACGQYSGATWKALKAATWKIGGFFGVKRPAFQPTYLTMTLICMAIFAGGYLAGMVK